MQERIEISSEPLNMNQGFWVAKGATATGCLNDGEIGYDNSSRIESKRSQQWFMEGHPEVELLPNKKQAVEVPNSNHLFSGMLNTSVAPWGSSGSSSSSTSNPGFHSWLYESETAKAVGFDDRNISSLGSGKMNLERKINDDLFGNESSFGLSMSHALVDPGSSLTYGGLRKVKVSEVKDSENPICVSMGQAYNRDNDSLVAMALTYNKVGDDILSVGDTYERADNHFLSADQTFSKGDNGITSMDQIYKVEESSISTGLVYSKAEESSISTSHAFNQGHSYNKGESTIISFGGYDDDANDSQRLISSYELLMGHASGQKMEEMNEKTLANSNSEVPNSHVTTAVESVSKKKDDHKIAKKTPPNNFPSNVRSLLSTGMLDGVPVKYIAWSREKELRGVIKGAGYLCGCQSCNFTKVINAYEFERHAACKTKHPNNHIYFENGKTIYGIVQELRSTPQNMLFDVIQTITGSPINQKSFRLWKESFLAATRELQRIYGSDEGKQFC